MLKESSNKSRILSLDLCKGICIISVIAGHVLQQAGYGRMMQIFYSFHMPMLFILSGYFISVKKTWLEFAVSRASRLLMPYVVCCGIVILGKSMVAAVKGRYWFDAFTEWLYISFYGSGVGQGTWIFDSNGILHRLSGGEIGMFWFLLALFYGSLIVKWCWSKKWGVWVIVACSLIGIITSRYFYIPFSIQNGLAVTFWIFIGMLIREKGLDKYSKCTPLKILILMAFWVISICFGETHLYRNYYGLAIIDVLGALSGSWLIFFMSNRISMQFGTSYISKILAWIGCNTMIIYCMHFLTWTLLPTFKFVKYFTDGIEAVALNLIIIIVLCLAGSYVFINIRARLFGKQDVIKC